MRYRTIEIAWRPRTTTEWNTCTTGRKETARLWADLVGRHPWRKPHYHDVVYTNQDARIRDGRLVLPQGTSGTLRIRLPESVALPGRLMEVRLSFGVVRLTCEVSDAPHPQQTVIGVDLGVNTLIAATDGTKVFLVSGRGVKTVIQWRNKTLACWRQVQSTKTKSP